MQWMQDNMNVSLINGHANYTLITNFGVSGVELTFIANPNNFTVINTSGPLTSTSSAAAYYGLASSCAATAGFMIKCFAGYESMSHLQKGYCGILGLLSATSTGSLATAMYNLMAAPSSSFVVWFPFSVVIFVITGFYIRPDTLTI